MSKEHEQIAVTVKCDNLICGITHTAFILVHGGNKKKTVCPACGWHTYQKDLNILQYHNPVQFATK